MSVRARKQYEPNGRQWWKGWKRQALAVLATLVGLLPVVWVALLNSPSSTAEGIRVTIATRTGSQHNPYVEITVDEAALQVSPAAWRPLSCATERLPERRNCYQYVDRHTN